MAASNFRDVVAHVAFRPSPSTDALPGQSRSPRRPAAQPPYPVGTGRDRRQVPPDGELRLIMDDCPLNRDRNRELAMRHAPPTCRFPFSLTEFCTADTVAGSGRRAAMPASPKDIVPLTRARAKLTELCDEVSRGP